MKWISHRGFHKDSVENSLDAFDRARDVGFSHIETDLRITRDGHIALVHDRDMKRVANSPLMVDQSTRAELESLTLKQNLRIAFLDQLLDRYLDLDWTFDIKDTFAPRCIEAIVKISTERKLHEWIEGHVKFLVWQKEHRGIVLRDFPKAKFYTTIRESQRAGIATLVHLPECAGIEKSFTYGLPSHFLGFSLFKKYFADEYHARGAILNAYLPETYAEIKKAEVSGFDEVLTDLAPS